MSSNIIYISQIFCQSMLNYFSVFFLAYNDHLLICISFLAGFTKRNRKWVFQLCRQLIWQDGYGHWISLWRRSIWVDFTGLPDYFFLCLACLSFSRIRMQIWVFGVLEYLPRFQPVDISPLEKSETFWASCQHAKKVWFWSIWEFCIRDA